MNFVVYSKNGCPFCDKVKLVLEHICKGEGMSLTCYNLGKDFNREDFYLKFGEMSTFPQVICNDVNIGGCNQTIKYLQENKLI